MMRTYKKVLVVALVLSFVLSVGGAAFAATARTSVFSDSVGESHAALNYLGSLGIYRGDAGPGGPARPGDPLTRAEFCAVVVRMVDREGLAATLASFRPHFADAADIPSWAWGYVNVAHNMSIIQGYPDGTFKAANHVTAAEAIAMLTRAMQNDSAVFGVWPMNYVMWGYDSGLLAGLSLFANLPITRGEMASLTRNALGLPRGYNKDTATFRFPAIASGFTVSGALVQSVSATAGTITARVGSETTTYELAATVTLVGVAGFDGLLNRAVTLVFSGGKVVYIAPVEAGAVLTGAFSSTKSKDGKDYLVLADAREIEFTAGTVFEINASLGAPAFDEEDLLQGAQLTIVMDAGKAAYVRAFQEDLANYYVAASGVSVLAQPTTEGKIGTLKVAGSPSVTLDVMQSTAITLNGKAASLADLADYDIVYVATEGSQGAVAIAVAAMRNQVKGSVKEVTKVYTSSTSYYTVVTVEYATNATKDITLDEAIKAMTFDPNAEYFLNLNRAGHARYAGVVGPAPAVYTIVKVVGVEFRTVNRIRVDRAGTTFTYQCDAGFALDADMIGQVGLLEFDPNTGRVTDFDQYPLDGDYYRVFSVDLARGFTIGSEGGQYWFIANPTIAVYQYDENAAGSVGAYIGLAGLKVGDYIQLTSPTDAKWVLRIGPELPDD
jgi:hypothetical protein